MSAAAMTTTTSEDVKIEVRTSPEKKESAGGLYTIMVFLIVAFFGAMVAFITLGANNTESTTAAAMNYFVDPPTGANPCDGQKPSALFPNKACFINDVIDAAEQSGADVTVGFEGLLNTTAVPITTPYYQNGMCPVNVHWHLGAEHRSAGEYDEDGHGPNDEDGHRRALAGSVRQGLQCHHYDAHDPKFTTEYEWKHCVGMHVGETYEVHWPHSKAGACGTPNQYQTPFYDGVFCSDTAVGLVLDGTIAVQDAVGVQGQVFTIVNDEDYYWPDLMRGMIVDGDFGADIAAYTGSTTGTSRNNEVCSTYAPITWQVDRKCHMVSASTFDKMCADMKAQRDDMSDDLHAHGSREVVLASLTANNLQAHDNPLDTADNA
jgi:hypothetical protein